MTDIKLRVALIGTGMVAGAHAQSLVDLSDRIEVSGVYSRTPEKREAFAAEYGFATHSSIGEIAAAPDVDAAIVLTPPNQRLELVEMLAGAGKHILLEKPVERESVAAENIVRICEDAGVVLGVVFQHRFREASKALIKLIDEGALGAMATVRVNVPWWREQAYYDEPGRGTYERDGGGVLISQAIHTLDLMLRLTGSVNEVQAIAATTSLHQLEAEDFVAGGLRFSNGAVGALMATTAAYPGDAESITADFDSASAHLQSGVLTVTWRDGRVETFGETATTGGGADPMAFTHEWHRDVIADFVDAVRVGRPPCVSGREALNVHRLIDALVSSSREKRAVSLEEQIWEE